MAVPIDPLVEVRQFIDSADFGNGVRLCVRLPPMKAGETHPVLDLARATPRVSFYTETDATGATLLTVYATPIVGCWLANMLSGAPATSGSHAHEGAKIFVPTSAGQRRMTHALVARLGSMPGYAIDCQDDGVLISWDSTRAAAALATPSE